MTIVPHKDAKKDATGSALLKKMKELARTESKGDHIVQVRVTPKDKAPHHNCSCGCS
jgi:hypothetical protein